MKLLTKEIRETLLANGQRTQDGIELDYKPVVKIFNPGGAGTWLLTELDPYDGDTAFGLCDLGQGCPELGYVSIAELESVRGPWGLGLERDIFFKADKSLSEYAREANSKGYIDA